MKELGKLKEKLLEFKETLENEWLNFKPKSEEFDNWKEKLENDYKALIKEILYTIKLLESPIYFGLLGRYSHGKTALTNSIFEIPEDYTLPEGEGVVTSKITRVDFNEEISFPKAFLVKKGGEKEEIDIELLRSLAKSGNENFTSDASLIDFLHLQLPARGGFSKIFAEKNISVIDMPGLGGPYFKDAIRTQKYIENMDFLIVVIKITEIDKAGKVIERFINNTKLPPVICAFTFYDKAKDFPLFQGLNDDEIQQKARELAKRHISSLAKEIDKNSIFVSSKTKLNINELRELILNFVDKRTEAIDKIREETPKVFIKKSSEIVHAIANLENKISSFIDKLNSFNELNIAKIQTKLPIFKLSERYEKRELRSIKRDLSLLIKDFEKNATSQLSSILDAQNYDQAKSILDNIEMEASELTRKLEIELNEVFKDRMLPLLKEEAMKFIDKKLDLSPDKKDILEEQINNIIENFQVILDWDRKLKLGETLLQKYLKSKGKDYLRTLLQNLTNPQFLMGIAISTILIMLNSFPVIGEILASVGILGILGSIGYILITNPAGRNHFNSMLMDSYRENKTNLSKYLSDLETCLIDITESHLNQVKEEIIDTIESETSEVVKDITKLKSIVKNLQKRFYELKISFEIFSKAAANLR